MVLKIAEISRSTRMDIPPPSHLHQRSSRSMTNVVSVQYPSLKWIQIICFLQAPLQELSNHFFNNLHYKGKIKNQTITIKNKRVQQWSLTKELYYLLLQARRITLSLKDVNTTAWIQPKDPGRHWT